MKMATSLKKQRLRKVKSLGIGRGCERPIHISYGLKLTVVKLIEHYIFSIRSSIHSFDPMPNSRQTQGRFS